MKVIGLTGGIGAGKSTVSDFLRQKGCRIIDADRIAHEITETGSPVLGQIAEAFGAEMIRPDGSLDRKALAAVVFSDPTEKEKLEAITTARVAELVRQQLETLRAQGGEGLVFVDAPLLFEAGVDALTDQVWLVDADLQVRIARTMERDRAGREEILQRIANQMPDEEKRARAHVIIDNSKGKDELYQRVEGLLKDYDQGE